MNFAKIVVWAEVIGLVMANQPAAGASATVSVPAAEQPLHLNIPLPADFAAGAVTAGRLLELDAPGQPIPCLIVRGGETLRLMTVVPARKGAEGNRRFRFEPGKPVAGAAGFRFAPVDDRSLGLWENQRPVLVYNHGVMSKEGVPADRNRSTYLHPIYGLDGEVLTDDFPKDHYHHRGLFWAWPHVKVGGNEHDLWAIKGVMQRFEKWLHRQAGPAGAVLSVANGWYVGDKKVMDEQVRLQVFPARETGQILDVDLQWIPVGEAIALAGAEGKSYGGLTLRYAPRAETLITTPLGTGDQDLAITRLPWADLSAQFAGATRPSGIAVFIAPDHPDYPPTWLTRHYGVLCVGWPGVEAQTFPATKPIRCGYRLWIHRGKPSQTAVKAVYQAFEMSGKATGRLE